MSLKIIRALAGAGIMLDVRRHFFSKEYVIKIKTQYPYSIIVLAQIDPTASSGQISSILIEGFVILLHRK